MPSCCPALLGACGNHSGEAEHLSGIGLKLFGFIAESVFTFILESCSRSTRNTVRNHPGIAFTLPRNPHFAVQPSHLKLIRENRFDQLASRAWVTQYRRQDAIR